MLNEDVVYTRVGVPIRSLSTAFFLAGMVRTAFADSICCLIRAGDGAPCEGTAPADLDPGGE